MRRDGPATDSLSLRASSLRGGLAAIEQLSGCKRCAWPVPQLDKFSPERRERDTDGNQKMRDVGFGVFHGEQAPRDDPAPAAQDSHSGLRVVLYEHDGWSGSSQQCAKGADADHHPTTDHAGRDSRDRLGVSTEEAVKSSIGSSAGQTNRAG